MDHLKRIDMHMTEDQSNQDQQTVQVLQIALHSVTTQTLNHFTRCEMYTTIICFV